MEHFPSFRNLLCQTTECDTSSTKQFFVRETTNAQKFGFNLI